MSFPNTPSQRWARLHGACGSGRRRLGSRSIGQYWKATPNHGHYNLGLAVAGEGNDNE